jgi:hypothetical protein
LELVHSNFYTPYMPKRKAAKVGDKEFRAMMLERLDKIGTTEPVLGEAIPQAAMKGFNCFDQSASLNIDMSVRTEEIRGATVSFFNGKGGGNSVFVPYSDGDDFAEKIGKVAIFGLHEAMTHPAEDLNVDLLAVEGVEWLGNDEDSREKRMAFYKKASIKSVDIRTGAIKDGYFDWLKDDPPVVIMPISNKANTTMSVQPELDKCVVLRDYRTNSVALGKAALQRAILALSREEANLHPDNKYHGSRKWAK